MAVDLREEATPIGFVGEEKNTHFERRQFAKRRTSVLKKTPGCIFSEAKNAQPQTLVQDHAGETARECELTNIIDAYYFS